MGFDSQSHRSYTNKNLLLRYRIEKFINENNPIRLGENMRGELVWKKGGFVHPRVYS